MYHVACRIRSVAYGTNVGLGSNDDRYECCIHLRPRLGRDALSRSGDSLSRRDHAMHDRVCCHSVPCSGDEVSVVLHALPRSGDALPGETDYVSGDPDALPCS